MFRILVVDDDPSAAHLLQELMKNLQRRHELHFAKDGMQLECLKTRYRPADRSLVLRVH